MFQSANSDIIKHDDLVEDGAISDHIGAELKELVAYLPVVEAAIQKMAKNTSENLKNISLDGASLDDLKKINDETKKANDLAILSAKAKKLEAQANQALAAQRKAEIAEKKAQIDLDNKISQNKQKDDNATRRAASAYSQLTAELNKNRAVVKDLQAQQVLGNKLTEEQAATLVKATAETKRLDAEVKKIDYSVGQAHRNVGNYNNQLGTLAKSVKGFGALGRILAKAIGIDPEIFSTIKEAGMALRDLHHIQEGGKLIKQGETAATEAHTAALGAETAAQEAEAAAAAISTGGITLLVGALLAAGTAVVAYVIHLKNQEAEEAAILEIEQERTKVLEEIYKQETKNKIESFESDIDRKVAEKEITELMGKRIKLAGELGRAQSEVHIEEAEAIKRAQKITTREQVIAAGRFGAIKKIIVDTEAFEKLRVEAHEDAQKKLANLDAKYQTDLQNLHTDEIKEDEKKDDEAIKKHEEALKKLHEIELKARDDYFKTLSQTNEEKVQVEYDQAQREIDAIEATEKEKHSARLAVEKEYRAKFDEARQKDEEEAFKIASDLAKKQSEENAKQADKDFKITSGKLAEQESKELQGIEENYAKQKDHSIKAEEAKQKAILDVKLKYLEIEKKRNEDDPAKQAEIQKQENDLLAAYARQLSDDEIKIAQERAKEIAKIEDEITQGIAEGLKTRSELRQQADQKDIEFHTRTIQIQTALAAAGKDNILAEEQAAATKAEEKKLQDAKKAQKIQENIALADVFLKTFQQSIDKGEPFFKALAKAAASEGALKAALSKLISGSYFEGTESTGKVNDPLDSNGGRLSLLHDDERVVPKKLNDKITGMSNEQLVANALAFEQIYRPQFDSATVAKLPTQQEHHDAAMTAVLRNEIRDLKKAIENKPTQHITLGDKMGDYSEEIEQKGMRLIRHHMKQNKRPRI